MVRWDTVAIVGVGLLGGSIGLALQRRQLARHVVGIGRRASSLRKAKRHGTVHATTTRLDRGVADAELVVVCTPVETIVQRIREMAEHCPAGTLITDVGSTKVEIVRQLERQPHDRVSFVGSHPLAGSDKRGADSAREDLFENRVTVVTPTRRSRAQAVDEIEAFWTALGARVLRMTPQQHDQAVAMTSHATHVIASALAAATPEQYLEMAASGWADTTRIAAADPELWRQILFSNREAILKSLDKFEKVLTRFRSALERRDEARVVQLLEAGKQARDSLGN